MFSSISTGNKQLKNFKKHFSQNEIFKIGTIIEIFGELSNRFGQKFAVIFSVVMFYCLMERNFNSCYNFSFFLLLLRKSWKFKKKYSSSDNYRSLKNCYFKSTLISTSFFCTIWRKIKKICFEWNHAEIYLI